jgi:ribonuclease HI
LRGEYRVRSPQLRPLHREVMALLGRFARVDVQHVPRERNRLADRLANQALENKLRLARGITCTVNVPAPSRR